MSGPDVEQTGEPGDGAATTRPGLGEDARADILGVLVPLYYSSWDYSSWDDGEEVGKVADDILTALNDNDGPVAALVAAAEERGFDRGVRAAGSGPALAAVRAEAEWRGAEKERERIVAELRREAGAEPAAHIRGWPSPCRPYSTGCLVTGPETGRPESAEG